MTTDQIELANFTISKTVGDCLEKRYPGHAWGVQGNVETGIVHVYNLNLSGQWGFVIKMDDLLNDPNMKCVIMAGGEVLERYNLSRSGLKETELADVRFDFKGDAVMA